MPPVIVSRSAKFLQAKNILLSTFLNTCARCRNARMEFSEITQALLPKLSCFSANERLARLMNVCCIRSSTKSLSGIFFQRIFLLKCHFINVTLIYMQMRFHVLLHRLKRKGGGQNMWLGTLTFQILDWKQEPFRFAFLPTSGASGSQTVQQLVELSSLHLSSWGQAAELQWINNWKNKQTPKIQTKTANHDKFLQTKTFVGFCSLMIIHLQNIASAFCSCAPLCRGRGRCYTQGEVLNPLCPFLLNVR